MVRPVQSDLVIKLDHEGRQMQETRGQVDSEHTCPPAPKGAPEGEHDRLQAMLVGVTSDRLKSCMKIHKRRRTYETCKLC